MDFSVQAASAGRIEVEEPLFFAPGILMEMARRARKQTLFTPFWATLVSYFERWIFRVGAESLLRGYHFEQGPPVIHACRERHLTHFRWFFCVAAHSTPARPRFGPFTFHCAACMWVTCIRAYVPPCKIFFVGKKKKEKKEKKNKFEQEINQRSTFPTILRPRLTITFQV